MTKELSVRLNGIQVGILKLVKGKMEFTYDKNTKSQISLSLPIQNESYKEKICRAYFGGLLPENRNIREKLAQKYNLNINNDFKLLEEIGRDCAGAISFHELSEPEKKEEYLEIKGKPLLEEEIKTFIEELPYKPYMGNRISLAGAQEKTAICLINNKIALPIEDFPTTHILKTAIPRYEQSIENEYICMKTAQEIGLDVASVEIRKINDLKFLLVKRFDREIKDNKIKRILQEDFAQSLGIQSRNKYDITFKDCLNVLNQLKPPAIQKIKFIKQVVFNYLIGNTDAHGKNFSIFLDSRTLTPAYDLLCSSVYDCDQRIAMKIGKARYYKDVTEKDWVKFSQDLDVSPKFVKTELERQKQILPEIMKKIVQEINSEIGYKILEIVQHNCK